MNITQSILRAKQKQVAVGNWLNILSKRIIFMLFLEMQIEYPNIKKNYQRR